MRKITQLKRWVKGESIHNDQYDQCVPDFSCCDGKLASKACREEFFGVYKARGTSPESEVRFQEMCLMFACQDHPKEVAK